MEGLYYDALNRSVPEETFIQSACDFVFLMTEYWSVEFFSSTLLSRFYFKATYRLLPVMHWHLRRASTQQLGNTNDFFHCNQIPPIQVEGGLEEAEHDAEYLASQNRI